MAPIISEDQLDTSVCFNVYTLQRAFSRFFQTAFGNTGFTYPKFVILKVLEEGGPMTVSELSVRAGVEPNTLSPILKRMAVFGLISRTRAADDERRVLIALESLGQTVLHRAQKVLNDSFEQLGLDPNQVSQLLQFAHEMRDKLETAEPPKLNLSDLL